ncbi:MAG: class I SAM-dependent methyltransferase [Clostridia bacterium]|nr:class I SAM-dependent methyltransferase [Clostridia bacterium]
MSYYDKNALKLAHEYIRANVGKRDVTVDATMGKGRDTLLLAQLSKKVYAFDIQERALELTRERLEENGVNNAELILDSHHNMKKYVSEAKCVVFNFGFLPGGDHTIFSKPETSVAAVKAALDIIVPNGFISICSYYGGDTGYEEIEALLAFLKTVDAKKYTVMLQSFYNRANCPPIFIVFERTGE